MNSNNFIFSDRCFLSRFCFREKWNIAIRECKPGAILIDNNTPFKVLPFETDAWYADPFLFFHNNKYYIFAEKWVYKDEKGSIAFAEFDGINVSEWQVVIEEPFHLSFPYIFSSNGDIFIVPESSFANAVYRYKAIKFPFEWEREELAKGIRLADSVFLPGSSHIMYTYWITDNKGGGIGSLLDLDIKNKTYKILLYNANAQIRRMGGAFFMFKGDLYRVAQNDEKYYGKELVFLKWKKDINNYSEKETKRVSINDIKLNKEIKRKCGIHTYNCCNDYEIIDIKSRQFSFYELVLIILHRIICAFKKIESL